MEKPFFGKRSRADALKEKSPQLIADVFLYATQDGGKKLTVQPGWGCPCSLSKSKDALFHDGWPLLDAPFAPGERRRLGFVFLSGDDAAQVFRRAGKFYLWEGRFIGEAIIVE